MRTGVGHYLKPEGDRNEQTQPTITQSPYFFAGLDQVGVWNWEHWCNEEFTDLHRKAMVELDPAKRDVMYKRMQDLMEESGAYRFITHEATPALYRDTVVPATTPDGSVRLRHFKRA